MVPGDAVYLALHRQHIPNEDHRVGRALEFGGVQHAPLVGSVGTERGWGSGFRQGIRRSYKKLSLVIAVEREKVEFPLFLDRGQFMR